MYAGSERAEAQTYLNELFACFGTDRSRAARFEGSGLPELLRNGRFGEFLGEQRADPRAYGWNGAGHGARRPAALRDDLWGRVRGSVDDLRVLASGAFGVVAVKLGDALTAQRRPLLSIAAVGIGLVCTVTLDLILIPRHGGLGTAIASTVS